MATDMVKLRAYGGEIIVRQVIEEDEYTIYVSRPEEVTRSRDEGREPRMVGFPLCDVVSRQSSDYPSGAYSP